MTDYISMLWAYTKVVTCYSFKLHLPFYGKYSFLNNNLCYNTVHSTKSFYGKALRMLGYRCGYGRGLVGCDKRLNDF